RAEIVQRLTTELDELDVLIVHNALALHFNLPLTAALWRLADGHRARIISWVHDISWLNPLYRPWMHEGEPWDLLRRQHPRITSIFVSAQRLEEWNQLTGAALDASHVIPNGIDAGALLKLGPRATELNDRFGLLSTDIVLLAPVRITKRKNLEWAIEAAAGVRDSGRSVQLLITGPPGPHNPRSLEYVAELKRLTGRLRLEQSVRFLFEERSPASSEHAVDAATLSDLYMLSDVVVLPSASEGFGLPLAEAALFRVPVVCTDLPAFREVAPEGAILGRALARRRGDGAGTPAQRRRGGGARLPRPALAHHALRGARSRGAPRPGADRPRGRAGYPGGRAGNRHQPAGARSRRWPGARRAVGQRRRGPARRPALRCRPGPAGRGAHQERARAGSRRPERRAGLAI